MKKYTNPSPIPPGGLPIYAAEFITCLQTELYRAVTAPYLQYGEPVIVYGCAAVANVGAGTVAIAAGMAFIDGDLIDVPAYAGAYPIYLKQGAVSYTQKAYKDQVNRNVTEQKTCTWVNAAPGAGDYILFDPYTSQYLRDVKRRYETAIGAFLPFVTYPDVNQFDLNGIGKWSWKGFAVPTGYGGLTVDMKGRVFAQYDPLSANLYLGASSGAETVTLTAGQIPPLESELNFEDGAGTDTAFSAQNDKHRRRLAVNQGGGASHPNIQPTYAGVLLQRITV